MSFIDFLGASIPGSPLDVLLVVEQPGQLVAKLEHLQILNCLLATMRLKYKSSHNPTLTACTNLIKPLTRTPLYPTSPSTPSQISDEQGRGTASSW